MSDIKIKGKEELSARLKRLEAKVGRREAVKILKKGAPPIKKDMIRNAPNRTGNLKKSIVTRRGKKFRQLGETVLVGPKGGKRGAPYAHIQELGSRGGTYRARGAGHFTFFARGGQIIKTKEITRRGTPARGFIEKAYKNQSGEASKRISKHIKKLVES